MARTPSGTQQVWTVVYAIPSDLMDLGVAHFAQAGIMEAAGHARRGSGNAFPLIGVAPARELAPRGETPLDPNHSLVVAVDNPSAPQKESWGSETETMYWLFAKLTEGRPSVTIVANGGGITLREVDANVRAGRR